MNVLFDFASEEQQLSVTIMAAADLPALKHTGSDSWQVHLVLLPTKKQRAKTGIQRGPCPIFTETFHFSQVESEMIDNYAIRFRLYSLRRMKKEKVFGEKVFYLTKFNLQGKMSMPVMLEPGCALPVSLHDLTAALPCCRMCTHANVNTRINSSLASEPFSVVLSNVCRLVGHRSACQI